ncbi:MAG TPA: hypothetical protein VKA46_13960 [Gemmataceae bacterium]|nr:hypothetical protein [Gemmataceae bacterium]
MQEFITCGPACQHTAPAPAHPEPPWPPPAYVRRILRRARRRLHAMRRQDRPSLADPRSYVGLFPGRDLTALAKCGCWPLPARALAWLVESPADRVRRCRRRNRRIAAVVRDLLAAELPEAVAMLLRRDTR